MPFLSQLRVQVKKIPGLRPFVLFMRRFLEKATRPLLNFLLKRHGYHYIDWDLITDKNASFIHDPAFRRGFEAAVRQQPDAVISKWTAYIHNWAADHARKLSGDFIECGVNTGRLAMANIVYLEFEKMTNRKYYLFDTYCGLDPQFASKEEIADYRTQYADCYEFVRKSFASYLNVVLVKGAIPTTLTQVAIEKVAYLHIDMNCVLPEFEALKFFWPKMVQGAIALFDDYAQVGHERQKEAMDTFAASQGVKILSLPTGQGLLLKF